jgi:enoyl-CoA hydratase/carnithine racemase
MYDALVAACDRVDADHDIRVFVLKGAGKAFASGTDISQFSALSSRDDALEYEKRLDAVIDRVETVAVATIAQVEGVAAGGGCAIALACDLRVCTPNARFGVPVARTWATASRRRIVREYSNS